MTAAPLAIIDRPATIERRTPDAATLALAYVGRMRSAAGRKAARWRLDVAARMLSGGRVDALGYPWHALTPAHVAALASALADGSGRDGRTYAARSANAIMAAVRGVAREAWRAGMLDADALARLADVRREPLPTVKAGRYVEPAERIALWAAAAADPLAMRGARDAALLALLDGAGLRASEAAGAAWAGADIEAGRVTIRGKGRKVRAVALPPADADALADWRAALDAAGQLDADSEDASAILRTVDKHGNAGGPLPVRGIARALDRLTRATGGACAPLTPHDLRRTFVSDLLDAGADVATVAGMAGHASVTTTAGYDRRGERAMVAAARLRARPYIRKAGR